MQKHGFVKTILVAGLALTSVQLFAACPSDQVIPGEYIIRLRPESASSMSLGKASNSLRARLQRSEKMREISGSQISGSGVQKFTAEETAQVLHVKDDSLADEMSSFANDPDVLSIEQDCRVQSFAVPNDALYGQQGFHQIIQSAQAWDISKGSANVIVAISDTGIDYNHPDLRANMWVNAAEQNGTAGIDDDNNGCIDDVFGCDTADNDGDPSPGPATAVVNGQTIQTGSAHGTHVAGLAGAVGNNAQGVAGAVWTTKLMAVKGFRNNTDGAALSDLLEGIYYAANNGARVLNCSWGIADVPGLAEQEAFAYARNKGVFVVVAAGNSAVNANTFSPAAIANVFTVAASNSQNRLASFSNFGTGVDIMAPGGDLPTAGGLNETIFSTYPVSQGSYSGQRGTSMAAPIVAGVAAMLFSINPGLSVAAAEQILINSGDPFTVTVPTNTNLTYTYRRLNARQAALAAQQALPSTPAAPCTENCSQELSSSAPTHEELAKALSSGMGGCGKANSMNAEMPWTLLFAMSLILLLPLGVSGALRRCNFGSVRTRE